MTEKTLNKYKLVIDEWFNNGFNGAAAYKKFYPKSKNPRDSFFKIQTIPDIQKYISEIQKKSAKKSELTRDDLRRELEEFVMMDTTEIIGVETITVEEKIEDDEGNIRTKEDTFQTVRIKDFSELTPIQKRFIKSVKETKFGIEVEFFSKEKAFEMLNRHIGFYEKDNNQKPQAMNIINLGSGVKPKE